MRLHSIWFFWMLAGLDVLQDKAVQFLTEFEHLFMGQTTLRVGCLV